MYIVAVVLGKNLDFKKLFEEESPFVKGMSYWTSMLKDELKKLGIELVEYQELNGNNDYSFFFHIDRFRKDVIKKYSKAVHIYLGFEPQVVEISHTSKIIKKLAKYVYDAIVIIRTDIEGEAIFSVTSPNDIKYMGIVENVPKGLGCLVSGDKVGFGNELYSKRKEIIKYAEKNESDSFAFFGAGWGLPYSNFKTYQGRVESKAELAQRYRYNFCLENEYGTPGAITEKIFDAMSVGMIPVYYGVPDIEKFIPSDCYIDYGRFATVRECFDYLKSITDDEYLAMRQRICDFMSSPEVREKFSANNFAKTIQKIVMDNRHVDKRRLYLLDIYNFKRYLYYAACKLKRMTDR